MQSPSRRALLDDLLDELLPPSADGELPAAGALGVGDFLAARAADTAGFAPLLERTLAALHPLVEAQGDSLRALEAPERIALVHRLEAREPVAFAAVLRQTFMGYYTHPSVPPLLGMPARPPQPLGHKLPSDDLEPLLAPVRARGACYRKTGEHEP